MDLYLLIIYLTIVGVLSLQNRLSVRFYYWNCLLVFLFITLRSYDVGSVDTINYIDWCMGKGNSMYENDEDIIEPGYVLYIHFLQKIVPTGTVFLMINTALALVPLLYLIKVKSDNPHLSLMLLFMPLTIMHRFYFVCQRQIAAMGILLIAVILFERLDKNKWKYAIYVLLSFIAYNFQHFSVLPAVLYLLLTKLYIGKKTFSLISIGALAIGIFLGGVQDFSLLANIFFQTEGSFYQLMRYSEAELHSGSANYMQSITATLLGLCYVRFSDEKNYSSHFSKMFLVGIVILNILISAVEVYRVAAMFIIFGIVIFPSAVKNIKIKGLDFLFISSVLLSVLYCYYSYFFSLYTIYAGESPIGEDTLVPYKYFWQDNYNY